MSKIENTIESLTDRLKKTEENLEKLRNLRSEIGSKIIAEEAWRRYLVRQIEQLKSMSASNDADRVEFNLTNEVQTWIRKTLY